MLSKSFVLRFGLVVAVLCVVVIAAVAAYQHDQTLRRSAMDRALALQRTIIDGTLQAAEADLTRLLADANLRDLLTGGTTADRDGLLRTLLALLDVNRKYDRVRVLDRHDCELIRIDGGGSIGAPVVAVGAPDIPQGGQAGQSSSAALNGELSILPIRNGARRSRNGTPAPILPLSVVVTDMQGHNLGRVTLNIQLTQMLDGVRRAGGDLGESLLLDGHGNLLLGNGDNADLPSDSALASAVMATDGDGHVQNAGREYTFSSLVYRNPRPLRGDGDFLEPPGTPAGSRSGVLKAVIFRPSDQIRSGRQRLMSRTASSPQVFWGLRAWCTPASASRAAAVSGRPECSPRPTGITTRLATQMI